MAEQKKEQAVDTKQLLKVRREKLAELQANGQNPFEITKYDVTNHSAEIKDNFEKLESQTVRIAGRMMSKRVMGKASFCNVQDLQGGIQCYVARDSVGEEEYKAFKKLDIGDIIGIEGVVFKTKTGEISIHAEKLVLLSKSLQIPPEYTKSFSDYTDHLYVINRTNESDMADFTVTLKETQKNSTVRAEVYTCANDAYQKVIDKLSESQLTDVQVNGSHVTGKVDAKEAGTLLLTIPYDTGWTIQVDGKEVESYSVGKALTGVHLEKGAHTVAMRYIPQGFREGAALSMLSLVLFLISVLIGRKREKKLLSQTVQEDLTEPSSALQDEPADDSQPEAIEIP